MSAETKEKIQIVMDNEELAVCPCGNGEFVLVAHKDFSDDFMAFCSNCGRGKSLEFWQMQTRVGFISRAEYAAN